MFPVLIRLTVAGSLAVCGVWITRAPLTPRQAFVASESCLSLQSRCAPAGIPGVHVANTKFEHGPSSSFSFLLSSPFYLALVFSSFPLRPGKRTNEGTAGRARCILGGLSKHHRPWIHWETFLSQDPVLTTNR